MFLDEPTNHLDIETTEWLEAFLKDFKGAQLIVSHDRYFLDQVCTRIVEVDNLRAWPWKGNYSQFIVQKEASEKALGEHIATLEKKIQSTTGAIQQMKRANKYDKSISAQDDYTYAAGTQSIEFKSFKEEKATHPLTRCT